MTTSIVYCYIGEQIPDYLFDSLYQANQFNDKDNFYLITNKKWENKIIGRINLFENKINLQLIFSEDLEDNYNIKKYMEISNNFNTVYTNFRSGFWIYTTTRFLYIAACMEKYNINNVFHIESDVMIYAKLQETQNKLKDLKMDDKIVAVQDSDSRAICSIVYIPNIEEITKYSDYIISQCDKGIFLNDMDLMGSYKDKYHFPDSPYDTQGFHRSNQIVRLLGVFDGGAIGQYLGGIDFNNIDQKIILSKYVNPTRGFINETSTFKPNTTVYKKKKSSKGKTYLIGDNYNLNAIHVHSKQLYLFSSIFDIEYTDIISGDRVIEICDFVITDVNQYTYSVNLQNHAKNILLVENFNDINVNRLNTCIDEYANDKKEIKLFVFIDVMENFMNYILPNLSVKYKYIIYSHNGDYPFDKKYIDLVNDERISKIYAQNLNLKSEKVNFLPIGIARNMFPHGNLDILYDNMINTYKNKKIKNIYVNVNEYTHPIRKKLMDKIRFHRNKWEISTGGLSYEEYLKELSQYRFCLCIRGNGLDTHRFWESLYLGVIPVVYKCEELNNMLDYLKEKNVPFFIITDEIIEKGSEFFDEKLRNDLNTDSLFCLDALKMTNYL